MTSANEKWQTWMDRHYPGANQDQRRALWDFWCTAIKVGRRKEREKEPPWRKMDWNEEPMNGRCDDEL